MDAPQAAFLNAAASKPASFLARGVRMVDIDLHAPGKPGFWDLLDEVCSALRLCTRVTHLSLGRGLDPIAAQKILASISAMCLKQMGAFLQQLTCIPGPGPAAPGLDSHSSVFCHLTLLEVGDHIALEEHPQILAFICNLPLLTHLGLNSTLSGGTLRTLLDSCHRLQLLVFTLSSTMREEDVDTSIEWAAALPFRDPRIVVSVWRDWSECVDWDPREPTYWKAAELFVEQKKLGRISRKLGDVCLRKLTRLQKTAAIFMIRALKTP
uniref:F-box domain-containing protein n=1 Tax=Mycena chlorophos TaxID=658473 RepID=A0ABQ0LH62_MYCCL|nr:predicted protein [Mycena chlorophos]